MRPVLLGYKTPVKFPAPAVNAQFGKPSPAHADFDAAKTNLGFESNPEVKTRLDKMLYNKVRVCPACSKPNGFTLKTCNSCGNDISKQELSKTLNVFAGFMLGIGKSTFPLTISIRNETPSMLVLDDLLALSPIHVNVIPMKKFIPDWRYLLRRPEEGIAVVEAMKAAAVETISKEFLTQKEFLKSFTKLGSEDHPALVFNPDTDLSMGFNFPPSQNQLHLQCIFPVVLPYQYYLFEKGTHFTQGRFFPFQFVLDALKLAMKDQVFPRELLEDETPIEAIVDYFKTRHHLDAEKMRLEFCDTFERNFAKFEQWNREDFTYVAAESEEKKKLEVIDGASNDEDAAAIDVNAVVNKDKAALQSYGRPYSEAGKPTGKFYSFEPKQVDTELEFW